jgi:hypothetical protein
MVAGGRTKEVAAVQAKVGAPPLYMAVPCVRSTVRAADSANRFIAQRSAQSPTPHRVSWPILAVPASEARPVHGLVGVVALPPSSNRTAPSNHAGGGGGGAVLHVHAGGGSCAACVRSGKLPLPRFHCLAWLALQPSTTRGGCHTAPACSGGGARLGVYAQCLTPS